MVQRNKSIIWKVIFLLVLFIIGLLIGFNLNRTKMELIQNNENNEIVLEDMKECCSFVGGDGNTKVCKALASYGCDECDSFCSGRGVS